MLLTEVMGMSMSMKELLAGAGFAVADEEPEVVDENTKHASKSRRVKDILKRPEKEVELLSLTEEVREVVKTQKDPTEDLVFLPRVAKARNNLKDSLPQMGAGYVIKDKDTREVFYAPTKLCLDANFIYRGDLEIKEVASNSEAAASYWVMMQDVNMGVIPSKTKYILDDPGAEAYEVYSDSTYPSLKYGKATPSGMFIHAYKNRFHRDMAILELDRLYTTSSNKEAGKLIAKQFKENEAIIISDGAWMKDTSSYCYFYMDNKSVLKQVEGVAPSEPEQAVLISEVNGAYYALMQCYLRKKTYIKYYYDNTSILNVFKNRKTEYIEEIKQYKELLQKMDNEGFKVTFIELHPKTDEEKDALNKALTFFHNTCDAECRKMSDIFKKDYKTFAAHNEGEGKQFSDVRKEAASKQRGNKPAGNYKPGGNYRPSNNRK